MRAPAEHGVAEPNPLETRPLESGAPASGRWLIALVLLILVSAFGAQRIQTDGGRVDVRSIQIPAQNGQWIRGDLFKPRSATSKTPAPLVVVVPGFQRSKEALSNIAIELARRGIVAISIDPYGQGGSSASMSRRAATTEGYGMFAVVEFAHDTGILNYVDRDRIGTTGHSAGGNAAIRGANYFSRRRRADGRSKLHSAFISGYVLTMTDKVLEGVECNLGASYALYDEGAYRNELKSGDMRKAPEALRLVNSGRDADEEPLTEIEPGRLYGDPSRGTLRVMHNEALLHPFQPYNEEATAHQLEFFEAAFGMDFDLESHEQTWIWKELFTLVGLIAGLLMLLPLASVLLGTRVFRSLVHPVPPAPSPPIGGGRRMFWFLFVLGAAIACFSYIPMAELSQSVFKDASQRRQTWFFPQRMNNAVMLWAVFNGTIGFLIFFGAHWLHGRKRGATSASWGARVSLRELGRTALLAVCLHGLYFALLFFVVWIFHVDYRFFFMGVRAFEPELLVLLGMYAPFLFVFFLSNSLRVNGAMRFAGQPEWSSTLLACLANSLGLVGIVAVQYGTFSATGTVFWTDGWLYVNLLFAVVPMMFVLPFFHRAFFRMTGRTYLGPMTTCLVFATILLSNTVCYLPI